MTSSQLRPSKEILNLVRLINRLDKHSENMVIRLEEASDGSMPDGIQTEEWYWELKSLETTLRHAKTILDTLDSNPSTKHTISQVVAQDSGTLKSRLKVVQARIQAALQACPPPTPPTTPPLRLKVKPPVPPTLPTYLSSATGSSTLGVEPHGLADEQISEDTLPLKESSSFTPPLLPTKSLPPRENAHMDERLRQNHRATEEELTNELSQMANQLKRNAHHFGQVLGEDRNIIEANATRLERNHEQMKKEGGRLGEVSIRGRQMTWFTIFAVAAVMVAWFMMFVIIRLT